MSKNPNKILANRSVHENIRLSKRNRNRNGNGNLNLAEMQVKFSKSYRSLKQ